MRGRDELARVADVVVALGEAPDGLPLVLEQHGRRYSARAREEVTADAG